MMTILVPEHVESKIVKRLGKLAARCGVSVSRVEGTTYLVADGSRVDPRSRGCAGEWPTEEEALWVCVRCGVDGEGHEGPSVGRYVPCSRYSIGDMPRTEWTFVARLSYTEGGTIVACAPGETCPRWFRDDPAACSHCDTSRRRKETFIIRHDVTGEVRQIGRNCLADFLCGSPDALVSRAELAAFIGSSCGESDSAWRGGGGGTQPSTWEFLSACVASVRIDGFRKSSEPCSTRNQANWILGKPPQRWRAYAEWKEHQPTEEDAAFAKTLVDWQPAGDSDYVLNLKAALRCAAADGKRQGLLASAPTAYGRELGQNAERAARPAPAGHLGAKDERLEVSRAKLLRVVYIDNQWGGKAICTFEDQAGHMLVWFASGQAPGQGDVGKAFALRGTVKKHDTFKGRAQTVLSRVKWEEAAA